MTIEKIGGLRVKVDDIQGCVAPDGRRCVHLNAKRECGVAAVILAKDRLLQATSGGGESGGGVEAAPVNYIATCPNDVTQFDYWQAVGAGDAPVEGIGADRSPSDALIGEVMARMKPDFKLLQERYNLTRRMCQMGVACGVKIGSLDDNSRSVLSWRRMEDWAMELLNKPRPDLGGKSLHKVISEDEQLNALFGHGLMVKGNRHFAARYVADYVLLLPENYSGIIGMDCGRLEESQRKGVGYIVGKTLKLITHK